MTHRFAGLDVSLQSTSICVVSADGEVLIEATTPTDPVQIAKVLTPYRRGLKAVAQESGGMAAYLHRELSDRQFPMVCIHAKATRAALNAQRNKTDRNDARDIARLISRGFNATVHIKSTEALGLRALLTSRRAIKRKAIDLQLTLRGLNRQFGLDANGMPLVTSRGARKVRPPQLAQDSIATLRRAAEMLAAEVEAFDLVVKKLASADAICRRFMSVPGVGPITALTFKAAVDDPSRFRSSRLVGAYFGLTPRRFQSGSMDLRGHLSKFGDGAVRTALYEAALVMLVHSKTQCKLRDWGRGLVQRHGYKYAASACARKLAVLLHRLWINQTEFEPAHP